MMRTKMRAPTKRTRMPSTTKTMTRRKASKPKDPEETITEVSTETTSARTKEKRVETPREVAEAREEATEETEVASEAAKEAASEAKEAVIEATVVASEAAEVAINKEKTLMMMASRPSRKRPISPREEAEVAAAVEAVTEVATEVAVAGEAVVTLVSTDPTPTRDPDVAEEK